MGMFLQAAVIPGRGQAETVRALEAAAGAAIRHPSSKRLTPVCRA